MLENGQASAADIWPGGHHHNRLQQARQLQLDCHEVSSATAEQAALGRQLVRGRGAAAGASFMQQLGAIKLGQYIASELRLLSSPLSSEGSTWLLSAVGGVSIQLHVLQ